MVEPPVRVGLVGTGWLGARLGHRFGAHPSATVTAIADIDESNRRETGEELGVDPESLYSSPKPMLDDVDAVVIVTPHALHYEHTALALDNDVHVLCEKPLTTSVADAEDLVERDARNDLVLMVGYQRHLDPVFVAARERWAESGRAPAFVSAEITQGWIARRKERGIGQWRLDPELSGGGFLYDTGNHLIDAVLWTTGLEPRSVSATVDFFQDGIDTRAALTITAEAGATANLSFYGDAPRVREHVHVWDGDAATYIDGREWDDRTLTVLESDGTETVPYLPWDRSENPFVANKAETFVETILDGKEPPATALDAFYATAVTEAAYDSAARNEEVPVQRPP